MTGGSKDDGAMSEFSKAYESDAVFREVADLLFGGGDSLIYKMNPDGADISTKGSKPPKKPKETPEWQKNVALATNAGGAVAAPAAIYQAVKHRKEGGFPRDYMRSGKAGAKAKQFADKLDAGAAGGSNKKYKIAAGVAGGTMIGLQGANAAGDTIAARMIAQEKKNKKQQQVTKSIEEIPEQAQLPSKGQMTRAVAMKGSDKVVAAHKDGTFKKLPCKVKTARGKLTEKKDISKARKPPKPGSFRRMKQDVSEAAAHAKNASQGATRVADDVSGVADEAKRTLRTARRSAYVVGGAGAAGAGAGGYKLGEKGRNKYDQKFKKSADFDVRWEGEISKVDADKQQVFGWASIVEMNGEPVVDLQGDYITIDEVEKSAYEYVHKSRKGGDMHLRDETGGPISKSHMIESFVITPEKKQALNMPEETPTGWWVGYQVNDPDLWHKVKSGERTGFSIHGRGVRSPQ